MLPVELGHAPYLAKPMSEFELIEAVRRTLMPLEKYGTVERSVREEPGRCLRIGAGPLSKVSENRGAPGWEISAADTAEIDAILARHRCLTELPAG